MADAAETLVSFVMPTYNCGEYICASVESALAQTYRPIEILVWDDGSTDDTPERMRAYGDRIRYIRRPNRGVATARNAAVAATEGSVIALLDADDYCAPRRVERQVRLLAAHPNVGFVACQAVVMSLDGKLAEAPEYTSGAASAGSEDLVIERDAALRRCLKGGFFLPPTALIRKSAFNAVSGYDESLKIFSDLDLTLRLLQVCDMGYVDEPLYFYRRERAASLSAKRRKTSVACIRVLEKFMQSPAGRAPEKRRLVEERLAGRHALLAAFLVRENDMEGAREHLAASARLHPSAVTRARLALAKAGRLGHPILSRWAHRRLRNEPADYND